MTQTIAYNAAQVLFVLVFAPLYSGVLSRLKELVQSKRGPSIFQPYFDIFKLFHKDEVVSEQATWIFRVTPYLVFVTPIFVTLLIPVLTSYPLVERLFFRPVGVAVSALARGLATMHHGRLNAYVGYVLSFLVLVLLLYRVG